MGRSMVAAIQSTNHSALGRKNVSKALRAHRIDGLPWAAQVDNRDANLKDVSRWADQTYHSQSPVMKLVMRPLNRSLQ
jgi:hypothetical protein